MAFFRDPGEMFLGCLGTAEQRFLVTLIQTAAKSGYTRFVEPCAGTFAMANLAVRNGFKPEQIETSDVSMMTSVLGYAITDQSLAPLEIHAQGFSDGELLDPATALYAQMYLRTSKSAGAEYFHNMLVDLKYRRAEHIASIQKQIDATRELLHGMSYRPLDMWDHLREVLDDPHALVIANPPTYFSGYEKFYDTQGKMTWKEPPYQMFDPATGHQQLYDLCMNSKALVVCYQEKRTGEAVGHTIFARAGTRADLNSYITTNREEEAVALAHGKKIKRPSESKLEPLECSMLPRDYEIREDSKLRIIQIKAAEAQYYRELWTHNFVGSSATWNRAVLIDGYITDVDDMLESYIGKEIMEEPLEQYEKLASPAVHFDFKNVTFAFLPHQIADMDVLVKALQGSEIVGVASYDDCQRFVETLGKYQQFTDIRNVGAAVHSMIENANERMNAVGFNEDEEWTYLTKLFGSNAIPADAADTIKSAIKKAEKAGIVSSKNRWELIERLCEDYLNESR